MVRLPDRRTSTDAKVDANVDAKVDAKVDANGGGCGREVEAQGGAGAALSGRISHGMVIVALGSVCRDRG
ncbi:MAG TPA: hypothetical protein VMV39_06105 [Terracidiphilus sp.]|nr:hypothetical protein [Terracidiphilus sp.]